MSAISYCRVKWTIKTGEVKTNEIEKWTGKIESDLIEVKDSGKSISWSLVATGNAFSKYFCFTLEKQTLSTDGFNVSVFVQSDHKLEGYDVEKGIWGYVWKIRKEIFAEMLSNSADSACTFNIVFSVEKKTPNQMTLYQSVPGDKSNTNITADNVLDLINMPEIYESKELEGKCFLLIMAHYIELKDKDEWNNLHHSVLAKIKDLPLDMKPQVCEVSLEEHQSEDEENDNQRELKEDLIYNGEFHSDDEFADYEDDLEYF